MDKEIQLSTGSCTYYDSGGCKKPLMVIHGFSLRVGYTPFIEALEKNSRLIIPDLPFATNLSYTKKHTVYNYTDFLLELIGKLKLNGVSLYGNSLGGSLALSCVLKSPNLVRKLIVRAPFYSKDLLPFQFRNSLLISLYKSMACNPVTLKYVSKLFYSKMARYSVNGESNKELWGKIELELNKLDTKKVREFIFGLLSINFKPRLKDIRNQVLILWPDSDKLLNPNGANYIHKNIINSQLIIEPNSHHCIATVNPKVLTNHIVNFTNK